MRLAGLFLAIFACAAPVSAQDTVFRSEVSLVRVDVQVLDSGHRAITGLTEQDFVLRESGNAQQIRNFQAENMPLDVVLLFDVSVSMRPHVERIVSAAHQALRVLGNEDRVALMVFDRSTRTRLPFRQNLDEVEREMDRLVHAERFNGGTDITRGLLDATAYVGQEGRKNARRAIVIVTDDQTERNRDDEGVGRALTRADAVLSLLLAPDAIDRDYGTRGNGGNYPPRQRRGGMGGGIGGGGMGGIWIPGMPGGRSGGSPYPGGGPSGGPTGAPRSGRGGPHTQSAGTAEIAKASGGDDFGIDDGQTLETTLNRLRQRYALHFNGDPAKRQVIDVQLSEAAARRFPDAELRFRRVYQGATGPASDPVTVSHRSAQQGSAPASSNGVRTDSAEPVTPRRRPAVSEPGSPAGPMLQTEPPPL